MNDRLFSDRNDVLKIDFIDKIKKCPDQFDRELLELMLVVDPLKRGNVLQILNKLNIIVGNVPHLWAKPDDDIVAELSIDMVPVWWKMDTSTRTIGYYIIKYLEKKMISKIRPIRYDFHEMIYMLVLKLFEPRNMYDPNDFSGCRLVDFDAEPDVIFNLLVSMLDEIIECFPNNTEFEMSLNTSD